MAYLQRPAMIVNRHPFHYPTFCAEMALLMPCRHENARPRKKGVKPSGSVYYRLQCPDCGAALQPTQLPHDLVRDFVASGGIVVDWDEEAREEDDRLRRVHAEAIKKKYVWDHEGWWSRYTDYLESEEWRIRRKRILERDGYLCCRCRKRPATQVHHLTYERTGHELDADLESVCVLCHDEIHERKGCK